eukprot:3826706-Rhodomonas_salina.1
MRRKGTIVGNARITLFIAGNIVMTAVMLATAEATTTDCTLSNEFRGTGCEACGNNSYMGGCNVTCDRDLSCSGHGRCRGWTGEC